MQGDLAMEYNKLTRELLAQGYTTEHYPEYVQIASSRLPGNDPLNNLYGGFEYKRWYCSKFVYQTGCKKHVLGENVLTDMGYMGVEWTHENNCPVIRCPYDKAECEMNDSRLHGIHGGGLGIQCFCVCHRTEERYDFENSIEKANKERREEIERKYQEYSDAHNGRICRRHMYYNERTKEWNLIYEPKSCASLCYSKDGCCPILGKKLSRKRGNVFYDLKTSGIRQQEGEQISIFDGEPWVHIRKGIRYFKKPCSIDICEAFVKLQSSQILEDYNINHSFEKWIDPTWTVEILNIRAESRPSRDLIQDLEDLKNGIFISYDEEGEKQKKQRKRERREKAVKKKVERLEKKIIETGYENLEPYSLDKIHTDKWLDRERIEELQNIRQQKIKEEQEKPVQLSIFDYM